MNFFEELTLELSNSREYFDEKRTLMNCQIAVLGVFAGAVGNLFRIKINDNFSVFLNLYSFICGVSGVGKSGFYGFLVDVFKDELRKAIELSEKYKREQISVLTNLIERELEGKSKKTKKEELEKRLKNAQSPENSFYLNPRIFFEDFTEAALLHDAGNRMFGNATIYDDELNNIFDDFINNKQAKRKLNIFLKGYEAAAGGYEVIRRDQSNDQKPIYNFCINLLGTIQPSTLTNYFNAYQKQKCETGIFGRFQLIGLLDKNMKKQNNSFSIETLKKLRKIYSLIIKKIQEKQKNVYEKLDDKGFFVGFSSYSLSFSEDAAILLNAEREKNRIRADECENTILRDFLHKKTTGVAKIATLIKIINAETSLFNIYDKNVVDVYELNLAISISDYSLANLIELVGENDEQTLENKDYKEKIIKYIYNKNKSFYKKFNKNGFTITNLKTFALDKLPKNFNNNFDDAAISNIITTMVDNNEIIATEQKLNNRTIVRFFLNTTNNKESKENIVNSEKTIELLNGTARKHQYQFKQQLMTVELTNEPAQSIDEIKKNIDFVSIIKKHIPEWRKSNEAVKCIFHSEKTGSLYINATEKKFYCFGCGEKGDILDFIRLTENKTLKEILNEYKNSNNTSNSIINTINSSSKKLDESGEKQIGIYERRNSNSQEAQQKHIEPSRFIEQQKIVRDILKRCSKDDKAISKYFSGRLKLNEFNNFLRKCGVEKTIFDSRFYNTDDILFKKTLALKIDDKNTYHGAIICKVKNSISDELLGIHRLYLNDNGDDLIAHGGKRVKRLLKLDNDMKGGTIKVFNGDNDYAILCEGVETAIGISFYRNFDTTYIPLEFKNATIYSSISSTHLPYVFLAENNVLIVADNDETGEKAAQLAKNKLIGDDTNTRVKIIVSLYSDVLEDYIKMFNLGE